MQRYIRLVRRPQRKVCPQCTLSSWHQQVLQDIYIKAQRKKYEVTGLRLFLAVRKLSADYSRCPFPDTFAKQALLTGGPAFLLLVEKLNQNKVRN